MKKNYKSLMLVVLTAFLVSIPAARVSAFTGEGGGSSENPYQIIDCSQLQEMDNSLDVYYVLMNDIDCSDTINWNSGAGFLPIAWGIGYFIGTFDGQGHKITGLFMNRHTNGLGLFTATGSGAIIKNVGLVDVKITGSDNPEGGGSNFIGGLVGYNQGTIEKSYVTGSVSGDIRIGGLVGQNYNGTITNSYATASVTGTGYQVGGLVGASVGTITNSYATGRVNAGNWQVGGLLGWGCWDIGGTITTNSYWDIETSGRSTSDGGTGKTTAEMMQQSTYENWDFVNIWAIDEGVSYPYFPFIVPDTTPPVAVCKDVTVPADSGCTASASIDNGSYDPDGDPITLTQSPAGPYPLGDTLVTLTVSNDKGESSQCTGTVTVVDNTAPTITCPANIVKSIDFGQCSAVVDYAVTANDNCAGMAIITSPPSGSNFPKGTTTVTATAIDLARNTATCTFTVTVEDREQPKLTLPADMVVSTSPGQCSAVVNYNVTATDNCPGVVVVDNPPSGSTFQKGTTTVNVTTTDAAGNTASGTFKVTVEDKEPPTITPPANVTVNTDPGICTASNVPLGMPATGDNCGVASVVNNAPSVFLKGTTIVTWTVTDTSNNTNTATQTVTVSDNEKPIITCPANITVEFTDASGAVVTYSAPSVSDNCGISSTSCAPPSGSLFPIGTTPVTCSATDTSNNTASCSFNVTVNRCPAFGNEVAGMIETLIANVDAINLKKKDEKKLIHDLDKTLKEVGQCDQKNACKRMDKFIKDVQKKKLDKHFDSGEEASLLLQANAIKSKLGCS